MHVSLLQLLRCPACGSRYRATHAELDAGRYRSALLVCACRRAPLVGGIPIFGDGPVGVVPQPVAAITQMVERGQARAALRALIMPVAPAGSQLAPEWARALPPALRRLRFLVQRLELERWRRASAALLLSPAEATALAVLDLHYRRSGSPNQHAYDYFAYRFGQPRHLVALALTSLIQQPTRPLLEIGCGFGHITRSLVRRAEGQPVVATDRSFLTLYVARHWVAPEADYLCTTADQPLPFDDGALSGVLCSDAFHYFSAKQPTIHEMQRVLDPEGVILLAVLRNARFDYPYAGSPLTPEGYLALLGDMPARAVPDQQILDRYLSGAAPQLAQPTDMAALDASPTISIVASRQAALFRDHPPLGAWPHAEGPLRLNPLYAIESRSGSGQVTLRRRFPSAFYAEDHAESAAYLPEQVTIAEAALADLDRRRSTPEVAELVARCVAIHMPERYD